MLTYRLNDVQSQDVQSQVDGVETDRHGVSTDMKDAPASNMPADSASVSVSLCACVCVCVRVCVCVCVCVADADMLRHLAGLLAKAEDAKQLLKKRSYVLVSCRDPKAARDARKVSLPAPSPLPFS